MDSDSLLISCDDHLDLNVLPRDLWTSRMPPSLSSRAPRVEERENGAVWVCEDIVWDRWAGGAAPSVGPKRNLNALQRAGIMDPRERRPAVPRLRLDDMDRDGVHTHVIYGPVTSFRIRDPVLREACYRAFNDWLFEFCSVARDRLVGVPLLPPHPEAAFEEARRQAELGWARQVNLQIAMAEPGLSDDRWTPLLCLLEEASLILSFHVTVFLAEGEANDPLKSDPGATLRLAKMYSDQFVGPFVDLFAHGILERHPKLKLVMAESGVGWVPWLVEELDYRHARLWEAEAYWAERGGILHHREKPSDLFKRQIYGTFQQSPTAMRLLEFWGSENLLWASDYPHGDSIWPNSRKVIAETMGNLSPATVRMLTCDNAARLYRLPLPAAR